ncbi:MAG TPA: hypothetical protein VG407_14500 [Caulobacteraceae bacterium]|jgi:hypothetical protein|nr:hypothetical protein [Caulobacteraceae bacterium]
MVGQDFDSDPVQPTHHAFLGAGLGVHLFYLVLAVILTAIIFHLMNHYWLEPDRRRRRRLAIYDSIAKAAKTASESRGMGTLGAAQSLVGFVRGTLPHTFKLTGGLNEHLKKLEDVIAGKTKPAPPPAPPPPAQPSSDLTPAQQAREAALAGGTTVIIANTTTAASAAAASNPGGGVYMPGSAAPAGSATSLTPEQLADEARRLIEAFRGWWGQAPLRLAEIEAAQNELV